MSSLLSGSFNLIGSLIKGLVNLFVMGGSGALVLGLGFCAWKGLSLIDEIPQRASKALKLNYEGRGDNASNLQKIVRSLILILAVWLLTLGSAFLGIIGIVMFIVYIFFRKTDGTLSDKTQKTKGFINKIVNSIAQNLFSIKFLFNKYKGKGKGNERDKGSGNIESDNIDSLDEDDYLQAKEKEFKNPDIFKPLKDTSVEVNLNKSDTKKSVSKKDKNSDIKESDNLVINPGKEPDYKEEVSEPQQPIRKKSKLMQALEEVEEKEEQKAINIDNLEDGLDVKEIIPIKKEDSIKDSNSSLSFGGDKVSSVKETINNPTQEVKDYSKVNQINFGGK